MDGFASFVTAFCAACVFIGAMSVIAPEKSMSKPVRYILSLVFIISVIGATGMLGKTQLSFDASPSQAAISEDMSAFTVKYIYAYALKQAKINFSQITVCTDKSDDGSIIITKVIIYSDGDEAEIRRVLDTEAQNYEVEIKSEN